MGRLPPLHSSSHHSDAPFPSKLYEMLQYVEQNELTHLVSWLPHGGAFKIHDNKNFMSDVANLFFRATKLRSIHRQLNLWGFKRVATGKERDAWYHPHFLRSQPAEMTKMIRTKIKGIKRRTSQSSHEDKGSPVRSFDEMLSSQPISPDQSPMSSREEAAFNRLVMDTVMRTIPIPNVELPCDVLKPRRRVSVSSPLGCIMSSSIGNAVPAQAFSQANLKPRTTVQLARRDRYQGAQDSSIDWMLATQNNVPSHIDPLMMKPLNLGVTPSEVSSADISGDDEFSLFISQTIHSL